MGWKHDMWAWTACVDTPAECLTLLWLNQRADDESGECFPSAEDIAAHTRLNRKTVFAAIKSLTEKGLIETKKRPGPGRRNLYRLCYERTENGTSQKWNVPEKVLSTSQKRDFQGAKNGTSNVPETVRETTIETTTDSIKKLPESSMRTSGNSSAIAAVASAQAQTPYPEDFDKSLFDEAEREARSFPEPLPEPPAQPPVEQPASTPARPKMAYPPCQYEKVVELYHANCRGLRRVLALTDARKRTINARWREFCKEDDLKTTAEALESFEWYFQEVSKSRFLMGYSTPGPGRDRPFKADFDWLMCPTNFLKVCEGKYSNGPKN